MDLSLIGAVVLGIVLAAIVTEKWLNKLTVVPDPPGNGGDGGQTSSSSDAVRVFMDNFS